MNFVNIDDLIINNVDFFVEVEDLVNMDNFIDSATLSMFTLHFAELAEGKIQ